MDTTTYLFFVPAIIIASQIILNKFNFVWNQGIVWAVALFASIIWHFTGLGVESLTGAVIYALFGALASNGVYDIPFIKKILQMILPKKSQV